MQRAVREASQYLSGETANRNKTSRHSFIVHHSFRHLSSLPPYDAGGPFWLRSVASDLDLISGLAATVPCGVNQSSQPNNRRDLTIRMNDTWWVDTTSLTAPPGDSATRGRSSQAPTNQWLWELLGKGNDCVPRDKIRRPFFFLLHVAAALFCRGRLFWATFHSLRAFSLNVIKRNQDRPETLFYNNTRARLAPVRPIAASPMLAIAGLNNALLADVPKGVSPIRRRRPSRTSRAGPDATNSSLPSATPKKWAFRALK